MIKCVDISYKPEEETTTFKFSHPLPLGYAKLQVIFMGELNDRMKGFYRSKYTLPTGEENYCAVSMFAVSTDKIIFHLSTVCLNQML